jgi:sulfite exporter TauE/SafE
MDNLILVALVTGLTTGGLSCFAVQGGLLSASIAQRVESDVQQMGPARRKNSRPRLSVGMIQPILLFMFAKLLAYTALGFALGLLGSALSFSPAVQGAIQLAIGVFLVGNALRMFNVHPIFRYFSFEPPQALTRYVRRLSKQGDSWFTPLFLGALTVLLPCGVTQSMMAVAIGAGNPMFGAMIMFAFVLGTSPTFVAVSWLASSLGGLFQKYFYVVVAVVVLGLGLYSINSGLVLVGSPVSATAVMQQMRWSQQAAVAAPAAGPASNVSVPAGTDPLPAAPAASGAQRVVINVENSGYSPDLISLPAGQPIELHLVTNQTRSCSRAFVIPDLGVQELLPETGDVVVNLPAQKAGTTVPFMCSMGMYTGAFQFK